MPEPDWCNGDSLVSGLKGKTRSRGQAVSYFRNGQTLRTGTHRLIAHSDGFNELYDHRADPYEVANIAEQKTQLVKRLRQKLAAKVGE